LNYAASFPEGQVLLGPVDPDQQAGLFGGGQLLEPGDRAAGADQGAAGGYGELVRDHGEEVVEGGLGCEYTQAARLADRVENSGRLSESF